MAVHLDLRKYLGDLALLVDDECDTGGKALPRRHSVVGGDPVRFGIAQQRKREIVGLGELLV